ncbi:hypothetical protein [Sphingomonas sp.]|uniref:hypothetical protein n=1 Tax=Sphingomonas sp. TaxID=28214 RepID=UPI003D6D423B
MHFSDLVKTSSEAIELSDLLNSPVSILLGVNDAAAAALGAIGIATVFDLGASSIFEIAREASNAGRLGSPTARFNLLPGEWLKPGTVYESLAAVGALPLETLGALDAAQVLALKPALGVETIREFSLWPPHQAARRMFGESAGATIDLDELQTETLRPRFGDYPTERVYYSTLVMLQMQFDGERDTLDGPVSLKATLSSATGFSKPAIGAQLTVSQSWYAQGITLGHMLHSLALAPGEATRIAVIDWSRRTRASVTETTTETEDLDNSTNHTRALSEVQSAVANEFQQGGSASSSQSNSSSSSGQAAVGTGLIPSLWASADVSGTTESASTQASAQTSSWSLGNRSVTANMAQSVNDRTEQHASSVRNRRASAVREVSQSEHEQVSTRIVANYNHMHALTVQYYEVVQVYRLSTKIHRAERCLFIPVDPIDFGAADAMDYVEKYRGALVIGALTRRARELLLDTATAVTLTPKVPVRVAQFRPDLMRMVAAAGLIRESAVSATAQPVTGLAAVLKPGPLASMTTAAAPSIPAAALARVWDAAEIASVSRYVARPLLRSGSDSLHLPDDTQLLGLSFSGISARRVQLDRIGADAEDQTFDVPSDSARLDLPQPIPLVELAQIFVAKSGEATASGYLTLECQYLGRRFSTPSIPIDLAAGLAPQAVVTLSTDEADRQRELLAHLKANRAHYNERILRSLDSSSIVSLLSQYDWNGRPLADQVEPRPVGVAGNFLILRAPIELNEESGVSDGGDGMTWGQLLESRGIDFKESDPRLVPIPTEGVFAEAVLGRSNSAEKLDITRFWNWQDSPIPLQPTEIAPVGTGSRAQSEDIKTGNLGQPVLNIVNPTSLPTPTGVGAVLDAVTNGAAFRDMSGTAGTQGLVRAGMEGTLAAATDAGQIASANMRTEAQKAVAMGQIAADIVKSVVGGGGGGSSSVAGISGEGAKINHGKNMDDRQLPPPAGASGSGSGGGGGATSEDPGGGSGDVPIEWGDGGSSGGGAPLDAGYSYEGSAFTKATQGVDPSTARATVDATKPMLQLASFDAGTNGGDGGSSAGSVGQKRTLPELPMPGPFAFPPADNMPGFAQHPALMATCPTGQFFGDPPTRKHETGGTVLTPNEAIQRQNDIIKAIAGANAQRPMSAAHLQHWLDGSASTVVMSNAPFKKADSGVPSFLAGTVRNKFESGCRDRLKNKSHSQGTLLPPALTPGAKGPVRFIQWRDGIRASAIDTPDLFTAVGMFNIHSAAWVQATFIKHEGGIPIIGGGDDVFEVEILHWCVQIYDVYDWNVTAQTPFPVEDADLGKLTLPPGAVTVRSVGAGMSVVMLKDSYFRDLEVSGIGRAFLVRTEPFEAPSSARGKFTIKI